MEKRKEREKQRKKEKKENKQGRKKQGRIHDISTDSSFGKKRYFCMVSTHV